MPEKIRRGGCKCVRARLKIQGEPVRTGLCRYLTRHKEAGGPFKTFAVWDRDQVHRHGRGR